MGLSRPQTRWRSPCGRRHSPCGQMLGRNSQKWRIQGVFQKQCQKHRRSKVHKHSLLEIQKSKQISSSKFRLTDLPLNSSNINPPPKIQINTYPPQRSKLVVLQNVLINNSSSISKLNKSPLQY